MMGGDMELLEQSNLPACILAAFTGLLAHNGRTNNPDAICDRAIELGVTMAAKLDRLETAEPTITTGLCSPDRARRVTPKPTPGVPAPSSVAPIATGD